MSKLRLRVPSHLAHYEHKWWTRKYIIGPGESGDCPWCALPLGCTEEAVEVVSEQDTLEAGFCTRLCAKNWLDETLNATKALREGKNYMGQKKPNGVRSMYFM
jgi:hypothetical protein